MPISFKIIPFAVFLEVSRVISLVIINKFTTILTKLSYIAAFVCLTTHIFVALNYVSIVYSLKDGRSLYFDPS